MSKIFIKKGKAIDTDHRITKQQKLPFNGIKGCRKTSCMAACQQQKIRYNSDTFIMLHLAGSKNRTKTD